MNGEGFNYIDYIDKKVDNICMKIKNTIFIAILALLIVSVTPVLAYKPAREDSERKNCFENQRILAGAIEMYNMDNSKMIENFIPGLDYENCEKMLIEKGYLKKILFIPNEDCSYGGINLTGSGTVFCKLHGSVSNYNYKEDKTFIPKYDKSLEKMFSAEYSDKRRKILVEKAYKSKMRLLMLELSGNPLVLVVIVPLLYFILTKFSNYIEKLLNK